MELYRVATELGIPNVEDSGGLRYTMSMMQLNRWAAFRSIENFGSEREDYRAGIIAAAVTNGISALAAGFAGKSNVNYIRPDDFFMTNEERQRRDEVEAAAIATAKTVTPADWKGWKSALKAAGRKRET